MKRIRAAIKRFIIRTIIDDFQSNGATRLAFAVEGNRNLARAFDSLDIDANAALKNPDDAVGLLFRISSEGSKGA